MGSRRRPIRLSGVAVATVLATLIIRVPDAPATVAEQRARLPPAAECESPVEGRWRALIFTPANGSWYEFTLDMHERDDDKTQLVGEVSVYLWSGVPEMSEPSKDCYGLRLKGRMPGTGTFLGGEISFTGGDFELTELMCGELIGYNSDNFTGPLEPERQEFQSIHNDGGTAVNEPTVFRRIACFDDGPKRPSDVKPPPFYPKRRASGGC